MLASLARSAGRGLAVVALIAGAAVAALAADAPKKPAGKPAPAASKGEAMMAQMVKLATPGPAHMKLKPFIGRWKAVVRQISGPGDTLVSEGTCDMSSILGGRYVRQEFHGTMMSQSFEGLGLMGYDNQKGEYVSLWVDNLSTGLMTGRGSMDESGRTLTMTSSATGPDGKPAEMKSVTAWVDAGTFTYSMYGVQDGKETLMMEITYTRQ